MGPCEGTARDYEPETAYCSLGGCPAGYGSPTPTISKVHRNILPIKGLLRKNVEHSRKEIRLWLVRYQETR